MEKQSSFCTSPWMLLPLGLLNKSNRLLLSRKEKTEKYRIKEKIKVPKPTKKQKECCLKTCQQAVTGKFENPY